MNLQVLSHGAAAGVSTPASIAVPLLHYAELTVRGPAVGRSGEILEALTRWVAFEDLGTWPTALADNLDPRDVVRIRFPTDSTKRPAGVSVEVLTVAQRRQQASDRR
jgi:hypothetical protein